MTFVLGAVPLEPEKLVEDLLSGRLIEQVKSLEQSLDLLVFPECSLTGFYPRKASELAQYDHRRFNDLFTELAASLRTNVLAGAFRVAARGVENQAVLFSSSGTEVIAYSKQNLFRLAGEDKFLSAGDKAIVCSVAGFRVSPKICYDLRFPDSFYGQTPDVDLFAVIANWPNTRQEQWEALLKARAIENEAFVLGVNRSGRDTSGLEYSGRSLLFDPTGTVCLPLKSSTTISIWSLSDRSLYETVGSTVGKLKS